MKKIFIALTLIAASLNYTAFGMEVVPTFDAAAALPSDIQSPYGVFTPFYYPAPNGSALTAATKSFIAAVPVFDAAQEATVDARLQAIAEAHGYGYKTANLMELQELTRDSELQATLSSHGCSVVVPAFIGIASPAIVTYLEANGINLPRAWAAVAESVTPAMCDEAFTTKQLPAAFAANITALGAQLKNFFDCQAAAVEACGFVRFYLHRFFGQASLQASFIDDLTPFLAAAGKARQTLIVRSTGMEDKKGLANAGGNESIKFVTPTVPAVLRAMGQVIESYFSVKSFSQRLLAGDRTIFLLPATPVLMQVMVSKPATGSRPIECVIHSTEQAGPTPGLASFNCGYDVVASSHRADQCYHFHTGGDHGERGHCILAKGVEHVPAPVRVALTAVATHIEDHYQRATDVELLITHNADGTSIVHVVQARPINRPATLANPSYVTNLAAVAPENIVSAQTVVAAGSSVRHITAQNQLIVAPTLAIALTHYLTPEFDKAAVLAVAVQAEAEPNSHEATTFASEGKLVMVARDYEKVTAWHTAPALSISLDPQQGLIINPGDTTLTVADGYTTHPIPAHVSIDATATTVALPFAIADCLPATETPALVTLLKQGTIIEAQQALASLLARINRQVETVHHDLVCSVAPAFCTDAQAKLAALERFARQKAVVILPLLVLEGNDLQRLATVKPLEALLVQEEDPALVDTYSVAGVVKEFIARKTFVEHHPLLSPALLANFQFLDMAHAGCTVAMTPELETKWLTFVGETAAAPAAQQQQLTNLWQTLEHFKLTSLWINTLFNAATGDATTMLVQLHTAVVTAQKALAHLDTLRQDIGKLPPAAWSDPEKYATNLTTLRELVAQFTSPEFIVHLTSDNNLAIAAALSTMDSFVDTFDRSIKALKASSIDHKVEHFKELLDTYYALLQAWAPNAQAYITFCEAWWLLDEYQNPLDQYLGSLKKALAKFSNGEGQLLPSPAFSVSAAMLGSSTVFERHSPNTAEDAFTLIHQNLLVVMGALTNHHFAPLIIKPQLFRNLETALFKLPRMQLISINYTNTILQAHYNLPIQHHSAVFDIIYDKITNTTQLITRFVGLRFRRWDTIEAHALLDADAHLLPSKTDLGAQEVSITYAFQSDQYFEQLVTTLSLFIDIANEDRSFVSPPNSDPIQLLTQLYKASPYNGMLFEIGRSALVKYGPVVQKIIDDVVASATLVIPNGNAHIQCAVMDFFGALVKNNYTSAFAAATTAATTEMASSDWDIRILAKQLFETLFQHLIDHINLSLLTINGIKLNIGGMARPTQPWQIRVLQHFDYKLVVSLTEDPLDPTLFEGATIKNIHLPIASGAAPTPEQVARFLHEAQQTIASGGKVIVHCNQGFNRTGTMLTLWLMAHEGMTAEDAIKLVREQRPGSISFRAQENFLRAWVR